MALTWPHYYSYNIPVQVHIAAFYGLPSQSRGACTRARRCYVMLGAPHCSAEPYFFFLPKKCHDFCSTGTLAYSIPRWTFIFLHLSYIFFSFLLYSFSHSFYFSRNQAVYTLSKTLRKSLL